MKYYCGIGSRRTLTPILQQMFKLGYYFSTGDWCLRSGAAKGADRAFEDGCNYGNGKKDICLPWKGFSEHSSKNYVISESALKIAEQIHPLWHKLTHSVQSLHARNVHQILGVDLNTPVSLVVCWTPDGCENKKQRSIETGGTATAIVCASDRGIPVYNLFNKNRFEKLIYDLEVLFGEDTSIIKQGDNNENYTIAGSYCYKNDRD